MDRRAQDAAVSPSSPGHREVVLATSIAETSLTIEGVRVVVDCGLARVPRYEPALGLTRLETQRVSRAAADQRRGRAGRTEPGLCYRLWDEAGTGAMEPFARPAILSADLSGLLLDCAHWGARRPERDLRWLDPPPAPALAEARAMLRMIGALDAEGGLTEAGERIRALALPPRLARMVVLAAADDEARLAAEIATIVVERGLGGSGADLRDRVARFRRDRGPRADEARSLARGFAKEAGGAQRESDADAAGRVLAMAFPDRIAKARGRLGEFLMANGRAAAVEPHESLAAAAFPRSRRSRRPRRRRAHPAGRAARRGRVGAARRRRHRRSRRAAVRSGASGAGGSPHPPARGDRADRRAAAGAGLARSRRRAGRRPGRTRLGPAAVDGRADAMARSRPLPPCRRRRILAGPFRRGTRHQRRAVARRPIWRVSPASPGSAANAWRRP